MRRKSGSIKKENTSRNGNNMGKYIRFVFILFKSFKKIINGLNKIIAIQWVL